MFVRLRVVRVTERSRQERSPSLLSSGVVLSCQILAEGVELGSSIVHLAVIGPPQGRGRASVVGGSSLSCQVTRRTPRAETIACRSLQTGEVGTGLMACLLAVSLSARIELCPEEP